MSAHHKKIRSALLGASALVSAASLMTAAPALAQSRQYQFDLPAQPLGAALKAYGSMADQPIIFAESLVRDRSAPPVKGDYTAEEGLTILLAGSGLVAERTPGGVVAIRKVDADPQGGGVAGEVEALIVTAQKREENIQDVPIAMSAFSQEDLTNRQVAGGPDLITQIPNMSFTKTNFSSYSIQIRGIGTQAISATTDPAVAVAFNNTPFIRNRFFEQEFYDLERLEVLRGPQGTLYGRNATAGVVNIISAKPKFIYEAKVSADVGNYSSRRVEGMINFPVVEDVVALRLAGAWTQRQGYAVNEQTGSQIDGRDLWSTRASLRFEPNDWISANLVYEHFEEDDDRLRSGKQLCKKHVVTSVGGLPVTGDGGSAQSVTAYVAQGCTAVSLYSPEAFQTPNGNSLPYYSPLQDLGNPTFNRDPYRSATQSRDLRVIESSVEPDYRAKTDIFEMQIAIDLSDSLTLNSETAYGADSLFSLQDYNRFTTSPGAFDRSKIGADQQIDVNGFYCDPQLGCSDRLMLVDLSTSESTQFSQEFRLGSDFDGPFNFSLGVNYLRHDAEDKYYVFINSLSLWGEYSNYFKGPDICFGRIGGQGELAQYADPALVYSIGCMYVDLNPIGALDDQGRNYFLSKNPYKLVSYAAFGEIYYNIAEDLKVTGGLRFTVDRKTAPQVPSWLLAGYVTGPYPTTATIVQEWREPTGRLAIDWKPAMSFTDETLVYASYAHGYKAGGANPPPPVFATYGSGSGDGGTAVAREIIPDVFGPEFIDAFEIGTKNTLLDGAVTFNLTGFYYDYEGYQVSEIRNRSAVNSNYDAEVWGAELEFDWRATDALRIGLKSGWEKTRIADGQEAIDLMDRTAGKPGWMVIRPFPSVPSNCILPISMLTASGTEIHAGFPGNRMTWDGDCIDAYYNNLDPITRLPYVPNPTEWNRGDVNTVNDPAYREALPAKYAGYIGFNPLSAPNGGKGFSKNLGGNELPNAPEHTVTMTVDYTLPLPNEWVVNLHGDYHWQSKSWWRVFNDLEYDRLQEFSTVNLSAIFTNEPAGWKVMTYVKNVFDETAITGAFLNSDDTGLTTNVFLTEPRLYGVRISKDFTGGVLGDFLSGARRDGLYRFQVEVGAGLSRFDGGAETYGPWVPAALSPALSTQDDDLDWGDIRDIKLAYAPADGWTVFAAYRYGRTNGQGRGAAYQDVPGGVTDASEPMERDNHIVTAVRDAEEFAVADFMVGKEVGLGVFGDGGKSTLSAGLRYASFKSTSRVAMDGVTDSYIAPLVEKYTGTMRYDAHTNTLESRRKFEGTGPALTWESSTRLVGSDEAGHADLEWKVGGGALFGKQTTESSEDRLGGHYSKDGWGVLTPWTKTTLYDEVTPRNRTENVTVPNLSLSLGLSYAIDRVKISTGYSYDRFFDAIDGGYTESQTYDRTIHGPYLKLSLGFGG
jgi:iron complex outermembrane receptor protein